MSCVRFFTVRKWLCSKTTTVCSDFLKGSLGQICYYGSLFRPRSLLPSGSTTRNTHLAFPSRLPRKLEGRRYSLLLPQVSMALIKGAPPGGYSRGGGRRGGGFGGGGRGRGGGGGGRPGDWQCEACPNTNFAWRC